MRVDPELYIPNPFWTQNKGPNLYGVLAFLSALGLIALKEEEFSELTHCMFTLIKKANKRLDIVL